jgi:DNA-binding transcriptional regulator LsrR (DeoR family)
LRRKTAERRFFIDLVGDLRRVREFSCYNLDEISKWKRMTELESRELYIEIAHLYYSMNKTQDEIAKKLGLTRQKVNKIIGELRELGVVTIKVNGFENTSVELSSFLEERFNLKQVIVADTYGEPNYLPMLAETAANYLERIIRQKMLIGVSWGITLAETVKRMKYMQKTECQVIQMCGAQNIDLDMLKSDEIARALADKLDCVCQILYSPVILSQPEVKTLLMREPVVKNSFESMKHCDMAIFGVGQLNTRSTLVQRNLLSEKDIATLRNDGYIGDICVNPVTIDGEWKNCALRKRVVGANMDILKNIPNVVAIAGGVDKTDAIIGCLNSGVVNTLVIDDRTAEKIVEKLDL